MFKPGPRTTLIGCSMYLALLLFIGVLADDQHRGILAIICLVLLGIALIAGLSGRTRGQPSSTPATFNPSSNYQPSKTQERRVNVVQPETTRTGPTYFSSDNDDWHREEIAQKHADEQWDRRMESQKEERIEREQREQHEQERWEAVQEEREQSQREWNDYYEQKAQEERDYKQQQYDDWMESRFNRNDDEE